MFRNMLIDIESHCVIIRFEFLNFNIEIFQFQHSLSTFKSGIHVQIM